MPGLPPDQNIRRKERTINLVEGELGINEVEVIPLCHAGHAIRQGSEIRGLSQAHGGPLRRADAQTHLSWCRCPRENADLPARTRTAQGQPLDFKLGAATVAARTNVYILPIAIVCSPIFLTKKVPWHYVPPERPNFTIKIMPPTPVTNIVLGDEDERHSRHKLNDSLLDLLFNEISAIERFQGVHVVPPTVIP